MTPHPSHVIREPRNYCAACSVPSWHAEFSQRCPQNGAAVARGAIRTSDDIMGRRWTPARDALLQAEYGMTDLRTLTDRFNALPGRQMPLWSIMLLAQELGLSREMSGS